LCEECVGSMTLEEVNVLMGEANWAWPEAVRRIFAPRGVNSLIAVNANDALDIIEKRRIHAAVLDMDSEKLEHCKDYTYASSVGAVYFADSNTGTGAAA